MKRRIEFSLTCPVRLTPLSGDTQVEISTSGDVLVSDIVPVRPYRSRSIPVVATQRGQITSSPKGCYLTMKVILPATMFSERECHRQVEMLFDEVRRGSV